MNPIIQVIETVAIQDLLRSMQKKRTHMAVLIDENTAVRLVSLPLKIF